MNTIKLIIENKHGTDQVTSLILNSASATYEHGCYAVIVTGETTKQFLTQTEAHSYYSMRVNDVERIYRRSAYTRLTRQFDGCIEETTFVNIRKDGTRGKLKTLVRLYEIGA